MSYFIDYAPIYHDKSFYVFGGRNFAKIARLNVAAKSWSIAGNLKKSRSGHSVIFNGNFFLVVGGSRTMKTEKCLLKNNQMSCEELASELDSYAYYPFLLTVDSSFSKNCS